MTTSVLTDFAAPVSPGGPEDKLRDQYAAYCRWTPVVTVTFAEWRTREAKNAR